MGRYARRYTQEEKQWLKENIGKEPYAETVKKFNAMFSRGISLNGVRGISDIHALPKYNPPLPKGAEKTRADGYVHVKVCSKRDGGKKTDNWKRKHRLIYEQANGKIPDGYVIIFLDGNKQNITLDNLMPASQAEFAYMNRNGLFSSDQNVTMLGLAAAKMRIAATKRVRETTTAKDLYQFRTIKNLGQRKAGKEAAE